MFLQLFFQFPGKIHHFDCCDGEFLSFVAEFASCSLFCLFGCVGCDESEYDWHFSFCVLSCEFGCYSLADVVEVWCVASDDASDGYYCVDVSCACEFCASVDEFEAAWYVHDGDGCFGYALLS